MFSYNSKFSQTVNQIVDCFFLSMLWIVFSLPVITIGASTTALYHAVDKVFRKEEGHLFREYWRVFRRDFKRATILWGIALLICVVMAANAFLAFDFTWTNSSLQTGLQILAIFSIAFFGVWMQFWFPYLARFDDPVRRILKNTLTMMMVETKTALRLLILGIIVVALDLVLSKYAPFFVLVLPVAYMVSLNPIMEKMFARYISQQKEAAFLEIGSDEG